MTQPCENWLSLVNICFYYARQTNDIYQALPYAVDFPGKQIILRYPYSKTD